MSVSTGKWVSKLLACGQHIMECVQTPNLVNSHQPFYFLWHSSFVIGGLLACPAIHLLTSPSPSHPAECIVVKETTFNLTHPNSPTLCCLTEISAVVLC